MVSEVDNPILSHTSWQQTCSLVTTSTKSTLLNFLCRVALSTSSQSKLQACQSQSKLQACHLPHWPHHLELFCKGCTARLWLFLHILGAHWALRWLPWDYQTPKAGCIFSSFSCPEQSSSVLSRTRSSLGPWSVKINFTMCHRTLQRSVLTQHELNVQEVFCRRMERGNHSSWATSREG